DGARHAARSPAAGGGHDQRHAGRTLEEAHLVPEATLAEHLAVVAQKYDDRVVGEPALSKRARQATEIVVDVGNLAVIGAPRRTDLLCRDRLGIHRVDMTQPARIRMKLT